jgi:hypothetical protein
MKSFIYCLLTCVAISASGISQSFAGHDHSLTGGPEFKWIKNFMKAFPKAMVLNHETTGELTKVSFTWNGDSLEAFYDGKGALLATTQLIDPRTLPISIQIKFREKYQDYFIIQAMEFYHMENGLSYLLIVKKGEKAMILRIDAEGDMHVVKKLKK